MKLKTDRDISVIASLPADWGGYEMWLHDIRIGIVQTRRHDEQDLGLLHLAELAFGYAFLKCEKMLYRDSVRFIDDLPPAIFAGCLSGKHAEM